MKDNNAAEDEWVDKRMNSKENKRDEINLDILLRFWLIPI